VGAFLAGIAVPAAAQTTVPAGPAAPIPADHTASPSGDPVAAEALFDQARQLMTAGRYAEACPKLEASQRLDPGVGTLLNLGDCLERIGRTASAWVRFREAAAAAVSGGQAEREEIARQRAAAIEFKLCRLALRVGDATNVPGLTLERDHAPFDRVLWNEAMPVDPGDHELRATAPGKEPWTSQAHLDGATCAGATETVEVPPLKDTPPPPPLAPVPPPRVTRWGLQRQVGLVSAGLGALLLGAGVGLTIDAAVTYSNAKGQCTAPGGGCPLGAQQSGADAGRAADFATAAFVVGGAALVGGGLLWFLAREHPVAIAPSVTTGGASLTLSGALF
jgi:hypothetical protein